MKYNFEGKALNIPDAEIETSMKLLHLTKDEAIEMWLDDNGYTENEEQNELDIVASAVKINHGAKSTKERKKNKPRTVKISDEKQLVFAEFIQFLDDFCEKHGADYEILKENKLFSLNFNGINFKLDIIQTRPPKEKKK